MQVDGATTRPRARVRAGQRIELTPPAPPASSLTPQPIDFEAPHVDEALIIVDKPAHLVVHPGAGRPDGTLVNGLVHRFGALSPIGAPERPGVVHRIDAGTSGLLVFARTEAAHTHLARQFAEHSADRMYLALAWDHGIADEGTIETLYGRHRTDRRRFTGRVNDGKRAVTHWTVIERLPPCVVLAMRLETGRTHQIRVHLAEAGHPIVGDVTYGRRRRVERPMALRRLGIELGLKRQALHAARLGLVHPTTEETLCFESPLPADLSGAIDLLRAVQPR